MAGYVVAVDTPYFSAVDENGAFTIPAVPPGTYTYHAWRPAGPSLTGSVVVGALRGSRWSGHEHRDEEDLRTALVVVCMSAATAASAPAQSVVTEVDFTTGYSSEDNLKAVAAQLRLFGDVRSGLRFNVEGTWARRSEHGR